MNRRIERLWRKNKKRVSRLRKSRSYSQVSNEFLLKFDEILRRLLNYCNVACDIL